MTDIRTTAYAEALLAVARAEDDADRVTDEMFALGQAVESDEQLRSTLSDKRLPAERRAQVIEDILSGKACDTTVATASMVVAAGRGAQLPEIAREMARISAAGTGAVVAEARSAVPLTDDQVSRLAEALTRKLGREVTVRNIVDPTVMGGVVTQIGDEVIDGSVRSRLHQLREAF
jgi:F-type H+-transporting ATPase subunit delta